jgi:hypothetical protein
MFKPMIRLDIMSEKKFRETEYWDETMELEVLEYKIDKRRKDCVCLPAASPEVANLKQ